MYGKPSMSLGLKMVVRDYISVTTGLMTKSLFEICVGIRAYNGCWCWSGCG